MTSVVLFGRIGVAEHGGLPLRLIPGGVYIRGVPHFSGG